MQAGELKKSRWHCKMCPRVMEVRISIKIKCACSLGPGKKKLPGCLLCRQAVCFKGGTYHVTGPELSENPLTPIRFIKC
jgi:hypothetical protein